MKKSIITSITPVILIMILIIGLQAFSIGKTNTEILINDKQTKKIQSSNQLISWPFYPCSGFNALNISKVELSGKPTVFFDATFKITAKVNWDVLNLTNIKISQFWDLFQDLEFSDDFRKTYKKGDDFIYESPYFSPPVGHQGLWTYNVQFMDGIIKNGCLTFSFQTKIKN